MGHGDLLRGAEAVAGERACEGARGRLEDNHGTLLLLFVRQHGKRMALVRRQADDRRAGPDLREEQSLPGDNRAQPSRGAPPEKRHSLLHHWHDGRAAGRGALLRFPPQSLWRRFGTFGFLDVSISPDKAELSYRDSKNALLKTVVVEKGKGPAQP